MLDIKFIRENPNKVKEACKKKQVNVDVDKILELDKKRRDFLQKIEGLRAQKNKLGKEDIEKAKEIKSEIEKTEPLLKDIEKKYNELMSQVPNIPFEDVPVGKDDSENVVIKRVGKIPKFNFKPKDYMEIAEKLDLIDTKRAAKVAGTRFSYIKGDLVLLHFALVGFGFDILTKEGFIPVIPPVMLKEEMAKGTGYFEASDRKEAYYIPDDKLFLVGTSEQSLLAMHAGETLKEEDLPKRYVGFSTCFRREAGSYGKDTKGILRVHQFDKLEMVSFSKPEDSIKEHHLFLSIEEKLMKSLKLPYQVVNICTGDLGRPAAAKYDIETFMIGENKYRETHSTSNCTDFQARRLNIRYKNKDGKTSFVHTINGTVFSMRPLIAIIENYQQRDGTIKVPKVLQKYLGFKLIR